MKYTYLDVYEFLKEIEVLGNIKEVNFDNFKPIFEADNNTLAWLNPTRKDKSALLNNTKARIIIIHPEDVD